MAAILKGVKRRTKLDLAQKKAQGALLGSRTNMAEAQAKGEQANASAADAFCAGMFTEAVATVRAERGRARPPGQPD